MQRKNFYTSIKNSLTECALPKFTTAEKLLLWFSIGYTLICSLAAYTHGILGRIDFLLYASSALTTMTKIIYIFVIYFCFKALWLKATIKPRPLFRVWWPMLIKDILIKERIIASVSLFIVLLIFLSLFSNMKGLISYYGEYTWDPLWAELDRTIHFGMDPWRILQPIFGFPIVTAAINILYNIWFMFMLFFLYWQLFSLKDPLLRLQFFYTFILTWGISGTLLAILFASGGPCFYEFMTGDGYFIEQMNYLKEADNQFRVSAIHTQNKLLDIYQQDKIMIGVGISAMPSMHVATAFLFYLVTARLNKWVGYFFAIYCLVILVGSVHLAWHYAVDGYFSIVLTWVYWKLSGLIIDKAEQVEGVYPLLKGTFTRLN